MSTKVYEEKKFNFQNVLIPRLDFFRLNEKISTTNAPSLNFMVDDLLSARTDVSLKILIFFRSKETPVTYFF